MPRPDPPGGTQHGQARADTAARITRERNHDEASAFARPQARQVARYQGKADRSGRHVWVERNGHRRPLAHCGDHDNEPYAWGRRGLGARELARALLFDATGSTALAERFCRELTHAVVARLPEAAFALERDDILAWLAHQPARNAP